MIKNLIYAILLGVGMAACLSQREDDIDTTASETPGSFILDSTENENKRLSPDPSSFVIAKNRVGDISIGAPIDSVRENVPMGYTIADTTLVQEGMQATAYILKPEGKAKGLLVEQACERNCQVWRIKVMGTDFKTPKGIGIGSKYSEVIQAYSINTVTLADGGLVAVAKEGGISFILDKSQLPQERLAHYTPTTLPANTLVKNILIY